jgi:very-short-patch-repair endonuclease
VNEPEAAGNLKARARALRNAPTEPEAILWQHLRASQLGGFKFRRQVAIPPFVADFLCPSKALVVEVDGWTHEQAKDARRDAQLQSRGYTTIRFSNVDVRGNIHGVLEVLLEKLQSLPDRWPHPNPSPEGEGL